MNPLTQAVLKIGLLDPSAIDEMRRFRVPIDLEDVPTVRPKSLAEVNQIFDEALQSEELCTYRETDLEVVRQYMNTIRDGTLHIEVVFEGQAQKADIEVRYGKTPLGEYLIGWKSESIQDMLANGCSYLIEDGKHIYFSDARELFFGEQKVFLVCKPSTVEAACPILG